MSRFTSADLLRAMGLEVGDKVKTVNGTYEVIKVDWMQDAVLRDKFGVTYSLFNLFSGDYTIIPSSEMGQYNE